MHVTIVDSDVSYPANSGKRLRTLNLMLPLGRRHKITYLARSFGAPTDGQAIELLADHGITTVLVDAPLPPRSGLSFYGGLAANLMSEHPYSVTSHASETMRQAVRRHALAHRVDLIQLEWQGYFYCTEGLQIPFVMHAQNVDALIWQRYHETESNPVKRLYVKSQWAKMERFERRVFEAATRVVAVSAQDAALARQLYGELPLDVVDNGVDVAGFAGLQPVPGSRTILFLGAFDWRPNLDAVKLLLETIFPAVRARLPDARLAVVGRRPPEWLRRQVAGVDGAALHADVPDVKTYLASSAVMAVPLRIGGGSRLKILESLAAGLPVVSSRVGAEGLELVAGEHFTQADTPASMAEALIAALQDPDKCRAQAERGRAVVAGRYDWSMLAGRLEQSWERAARLESVPA